MSRFDAPWDRQLRAGTWIAVGVLCVVGVGLPVLGRLLGGADLALVGPFLIGPVAAASILAGAWALAPTGYVVRGPELVVERPLAPVRIPLARIRSVDLVPDADLACAARVAGNGGLFGWYGRFWSRRLGAFRLYATRRSGLVRVDTDRERFVLSPGAPEAFVAAVLARAPAASRGPGADPAAGGGRPPGPRVARLAAFLVVGIAAAVALVFAGVWGLSPVGVEVAGDAVRVERRWVRPVELPLASVRAAEVLAPPYGRRWWRTNGTAIGAVRYGRFASRELGPFRLWAWRHGPYVLLETDEGRVVLTPDDPQRFVAEVRERIGGR